MNENINAEIMDKLTKVCICKAISRASIKKAIKDGARTIDEVKQVTGACSGGCGGKRCVSKIQELIDANNNN